MKLSRRKRTSPSTLRKILPCRVPTFSRCRVARGTLIRCRISWRLMSRLMRVAGVRHQVAAQHIEDFAQQVSSPNQAQVPGSQVDRASRAAALAGCRAGRHRPAGPETKARAVLQTLVQAMTTAAPASAHLCFRGTRRHTSRAAVQHEAHFRGDPLGLRWHRILSLQLRVASYFFSFHDSPQWLPIRCPASACQQESLR